MIGHAKTLAALIFIAGTVALGFEDEFFTEDTTDNLGELEVTKGELEANHLYRREPELKRSQEAALAETSHVRLQDEAALAVIQGTRRRPGSSYNNRATSKPAIRRGCVTEGAVFAEGSAMVSPDECSYCFCIRGKQRCVAPKCLLPVEGCRPRYRTFSCCPSYYDCHDASTTTTTTSRTPRDCQVDGVRYSEGSLVEGAGGECENCYCLNGEVTCTRTTCAPPLDGCKPVMQEGHCCPVKYDCDDGNRRVSVDQFFKDFPVKISTADQRSEFDRMRPEWQTNMARKSPGGDTIIADTENERSLSETSETEAIPVETEPSPVEDTDEEPPVEESPNKRPRLRPGTRPRKRFSSLISRPSGEELANRRKQTRYSNQRRPTFQRPRHQTQSLSFRLRQRIKLDKEKNKTLSSTTPTTPSPTSTNNEITDLVSTSSSTTPSTSTSTNNEIKEPVTTSSSTTPSTSPPTLTMNDVSKESEFTSSSTTASTSPSTLANDESNKPESTSSSTTPPTSTASLTTTLLSSESTTNSLQASTTEQTTTSAIVEDDISTITEFDTTVYEETDPSTTEYADDITLAYGPVLGVLDMLIKSESSVDTSDDVTSENLPLPVTTNQIPTQEPYPIDETTVAPSMAVTTITPASTSTAPPSTTTTSTTSLLPITILTTTESEDEPLPEVSGVGHVGEAFLVQDFYELTTPPSIQGSPVFSVDEQIEIGTGVNVKGSLSDAVAFGPILVFDNRVRTDRQHKDVNTTEVDVAGDEENTVVTDIPEETTMLTKADSVDDDKVITDEATANTELLTDYDEGTEELTTLFPTFPFVRDTTVKSLSELLSTATAASTVTTTETPANVSSPAIDTLENSTGDDPEYTDIETAFPSYDITVGTSVLATNQAQPPSSGVGEVISVELKPEHKTPEIESAPEVDAERPSLLGTILNILTRTERPRPARLPPPPPPRPPFRPRPRPNGRPNTRPDFIPPRFRFTPPSPVASERDTTEEPESNTLTSSPAPLIIPTTRAPLIVIPTSQPASVINRPVLGFNRPPTPIINIPVHSATRPEVIPGHPGLSNRPDFFLNHPVAVAPQPNIHGLPSEPVIEGGFEGMRDNEEGIQPNFDFSDYDNNEEPTLPPSLPNLKIIPFVAADALVNQEIGIAGDEFLATPLLLADAGDDNQDTQRPAETTEATTTTRRPFLRLPIGDRRPPILPPRRTGVRPGDGSTTRRPFFRRPGERPSRPPFSSKTSTTTTTTTTTTSAPEKEEPVGLPKPKPNFRPNIPFTNRERSSTRPPFIPPRRHTPTTTTPTTTKSTTTKPTTTPSTTTHPPQVFITTPRPIVSDDIANLLLQDVFGLSGGQNTPPVRFTPARTTPKPIIPMKISTVLPEIPSAVRDQLPLATDPVLASGLLKLSGCNIYGRMYNVGEQITELSAACKECRCTPVGVQCLPVC